MGTFYLFGCWFIFGCARFSLLCRLSTAALSGLIAVAPLVVEYWLSVHGLQ